LTYHLAHMNVARFRYEPDDPRIIVNLSVWESPEALQAFAYRSEHVQFFRRPEAE